ncbi:S8 family serine peptidase [Planomicrobium sp. MB-3u-38]|uniref:S8 family peptidase n=1 Tax=Planomicrobium sp. MB-3u-38 TaxID=2058318 RepID=UPI000C7A9FAF|nr:S8 family serine peptidase [Planomicrobium sp. MB-3u-38]PKH10565.1 alkaline serine protease [Planomicrobium sp. MB-3u-38]
MKKTAITFILLVLLISMSITPAFAATSENDLEKVIISFEDSIDYQALEDMGAEIHSELDAISSVIATIPSATVMKADTEVSVKNIPEGPIFKAAAQQPSWGYQHIKAPSALKLGYTGKGVKIAVIDSGINSKHPDLSVAGGASMIDNTSPFTDGAGHGTHVAGVIAALNNTIGVVGAAPDAEIYSVKVLASSGAGTLEDVLEGIQWAIDQDMDIINLSLTTDFNIPELEALLKKANELGIIVVAAAGNIEIVDTRGNYVQNTSDVLYPARYPSVIAVGSTDTNNRLSGFSYRGPSVEIVAPGQGIYSTFSTIATSGHDDYKSSEGTSVSTPFVSAVFAQYKEAYPHLTNAQLRASVKRAVIDLGVKGKDNLYGHGLVQSLQWKVALFPDLRTDYWYSESIQYIFDRGIVTGFPDGTYRPESTITRAEAMTMIGRALGLKTDATKHYFKDVKTDSYAAGYINKAYELGYIKGVTSTSFNPESPIKRGDMAVIMKRVFELTSSGDSTFSDVDASKYYAEAVQATYENGIVQGYKIDNTFRPEASITRAENAEILSKSLKLQ